jgi:[ribosomal protein S5]-alanine N-acetyltransferase
MFVRTKRLLLRPCWPEDRSELLEVINEDSSNSGMLPWPLTADDVQKFLDRPLDNLFPHFFIALPDGNGGQMVGGIGLGKDGAEVGLGYWIAKRYRGNGYGPEAITAVLNIARTLGHKRIIASHAPDSPAAGHILERVGFVPTTKMRSRLARKSKRGMLPTTYVFANVEIQTPLRA